MQGCDLCLVSMVPLMLNVAGPCLAPGVTFWWSLVATMLFFGLFMAGRCCPNLLFSHYCGISPKGRGLP